MSRQEELTLTHSLNTLQPFAQAVVKPPDSPAPVAAVAPAAAAFGDRQLVAYPLAAMPAVGAAALVPDTLAQDSQQMCKSSRALAAAPTCVDTTCIPPSL